MKRLLLFAFIVFFTLHSNAFRAEEKTGTPDQKWIEEHVDRLEWHTHTPYVERTDHDDGVYLRYSDSAYAYFKHSDAGKWNLALWHVAEDVSDELYISFYPNCLSLQSLIDNGGYQIRWLYGSPAIPLDMNQIAMENLPISVNETLSIWDSTDWAVITDDEQTLYSDTSKGSDTVCVLFAGAPVRVLERRENWIRVSAASLIGWVPETSVNIGADMLTAEQRFPDLCTCVENVTPQTHVYAAPDKESSKLHALYGLKQESLDRISVIGVVDSNWYLVFSPDGIQGCMESRCFNPGNG